MKSSSRSTKTDGATATGASPSSAAAPTKRKRSPSKKAATTTTSSSPLPPSPSSSSAAAAAKKTKKPKKTAAATVGKQQKRQVVTAQTAPPPPTHYLVVDNGGETIKYGWAKTAADGTSSTAATTTTTAAAPMILNNLTARLAQQWTILVADQLDSITNPNQLIGVTRSMERGMITNMGNQVQVWKRMLDLLGVVIPIGNQSNNAEAARAFGWKASPTASSSTSTAASKKKKKQQQTSKAEEQSSFSTAAAVSSSIPASTCAILLTVPPHCPRTLLDQIVLVWMQDFGFARVGLVTGPLMVAQSLLLLQHSSSSSSSSSSSLPDKKQDNTSQDKDTIATNNNNCKNINDLQTSCIIDMGWSATHIVPTYRGRPILAAAAAPQQTAPPQTDQEQQQQQQQEQEQQQPQYTIRRLPLGGRHLINLWKYYCTYRQYNLMDQDWILRDVLIQTAFLSLSDDEMQQACQIPAGLRPYDAEYILPDYQTTFEGKVRVSPALLHAQQRQREEIMPKQQEQEAEDDDDDDDEEDEDFRDEDAMEEDEDDYGNEDDNGAAAPVADEDGDNEDEEEEEDVDALRKRLLKQRQEEERRRLQEEQEQQVLPVSTERFAIPEVLFRPSDAGLPSEWPGLASAIVEAIQACPEYYRAALYRSIHVVGGLSQLTNLQERLQRELRALVPCEYEVSITMASSSASSPSPSSATDQTWLGAVQKANTEPYTSWSVSREEWEASSKRGTWNRLLVGQGGSLV